MKLLIDDCFGPEVARRLRDERDQDAVSALEHAGLRGKADRDLFEAAQSDGRALVTENVVDYMPIVLECETERRTHHGLVFTSAERFPRGDPETPERLAEALDALVRERVGHKKAVESPVCWL